MIKLVVLVLAAAVFVQGRPDYTGYNDDIVEAAASGDWDQVGKLLTSGLEEDGIWKSLALGDVKELKPAPGGHVYGESEFTFHESSDVNGQKSEKSGGHKVINDDGKVSEYDFKPQISH